MAEPEPKRAAAERAIVEETPVEALASDSATIAVVEVPRTVNGTGHTDPSEFCATSI